jgi:Icc-related predicted phosphoesterase
MAYRVAYATDLHGNRELYALLLSFALADSCKALIIGGDITPKGTYDWAPGEPIPGVLPQEVFLQDYLIPTLKAFHQEAAIDLYIMMGNDDRRINLPLLETEEAAGTLRLLHERVYRLAQYNIVGYPFIPPSPFFLKDWEKYEDRGKLAPLWQDPCLEISETGVRTVRSVEKTTIAEDLLQLKELCSPRETIYLFHAPPYGTDLDLIEAGGSRYQGLPLDPHVGSTAIKRFIKSEQPPLTLHGHVHLSYKLSRRRRTTIGRTICVNPGSQYDQDILNLALLDLENLNAIEFLELTP